MFQVCKECKGKCCTGPFISWKEMVRIEEETREICPANVVGDEKDGLMKIEPLPDGRCPYSNGSGCSLKNRPIACKIYPFIPTRYGWVIRASCPFWSMFTKEDMREAIRVFNIDKGEWKGELPE